MHNLGNPANIPRNRVVVAVRRCGCSSAWPRKNRNAKSAAACKEPPNETKVIPTNRDSNQTRRLVDRVNLGWELIPRPQYMSRGSSTAADIHKVQAEVCSYQ